MSTHRDMLSDTLATAQIQADTEKVTLTEILLAKILLRLQIEAGIVKYDGRETENK